ncbi:3-hexulose-6-phosphate synthase [Paenibacillus pasadenensis]|uniref:3-hexulose-6-phosphate synthase n=1 Tax=Paenibacillus pasadenensis TaxID=217090 RepID=UPI00203C4E10|nr:3-hexulose-6-phosphate synthase [Paenibacillus pasadenensis]MCM3747688.1 3-hexulose-6-phosphate synthase [Paenibacillus pasadenensis]
MELQLALDLVDIKGAIEVVDKVAEYVDIVEIGTPIVINEGLHAVKAIKQAFPQLRVLADLKVMDAGGYEVMKASEAGADIVTILGVSDDATIRGGVEEARKQGRQVMIDMINVRNLEERAREVDALGVDYICVHAGYDHQAEGKNSFDQLRAIKGVVTNARTAVAGGIKLETLPEVIAAGPDLVIVGGGIASQDDPKAAAAAMRELVAARS